MYTLIIYILFYTLYYSCLPLRSLATTYIHTNIQKNMEIHCAIFLANISRILFIWTALNLEINNCRVTFILNLPASWINIIFVTMLSGLLDSKISSGDRRVQYCSVIMSFGVIIFGWIIYGQFKIEIIGIFHVFYFH